MPSLLQSTLVRLTRSRAGATQSKPVTDEPKMRAGAGVAAWAGEIGLPISFGSADFDAKQTARDAYDANPMARAGLRAFFTGLTAAEVFVTPGQNEEGEYERDELSTLEARALNALVACPHPHFTPTWAAFVSQAALDFKTFGACVILPIFPKTGSAKEGLVTERPHRLRLLDPDKLAAKPTADRTGVESFKYAGRTYRPEQLIIYRAPGHAELDGAGDLEAAGRNLDAWNVGMKWRSDLLKKRAVVPFALTLPGKLSDPEKEQLREFYDKARRGNVGEGEIMLLPEGAERIPLTEDLADLELNASIQHDETNVLNALGVSPIMVGNASGQTFSNKRWAKIEHYTELVLPWLEGLLGHLNPRLERWFGVSLWYNRAGIEALREDQDALHKRLRSAKDYSLNEVRRSLGQPEFEHPWADIPKYLLETGYKPLPEGEPERAPLSSGQLGGILQVVDRLRAGTISQETATVLLASLGVESGVIEAIIRAEAQAGVQPDPADETLTVNEARAIQGEPAIDHPLADVPRALLAHVSPEQTGTIASLAQKSRAEIRQALETEYQAALAELESIVRAS